MNHPTNPSSSSAAFPAAAPAVEPASVAVPAGVRSLSPPALTPRLFVLLLLAVICVAYPDVVLGTHTFFYRDYAQFGYPLAWQLKQSFWQGQIPLWNPLNNSGLPFLAQWNTMTLYPPVLFYVLLPLPWALGVFNLLHLILGGLGMYFLARRWTGNETASACVGAAFAFSGLSLHCLMWPNNVAALGWMPWVVWQVEKAWTRGGSRVITAGLISALQVLAGAPEILIFTWLVVGALFTGHFWRLSGARITLAWRMAGIALLVSGLTAAQMLPFLDLVLHSHRSRDFGGDTWAMPAWGWANLIAPMFRCTPSRLGVFSQDEQQWTSSYYPGIGVMAFALVALWRVRKPAVWCFGAVALGGLVMALGKNGHVHPVLRDVFPFLGFIRFPIKFVVLAMFAIPLLAAFGFDWIQRSVSNEPKSARRALIGVGASVALLVAALFLVSQHSPVPNESVARTFNNGITRLLLLGTILTGAWFLGKGGARGRWVGLVMILVVSLDGITHMPRQNPTVPAEAYGPVRLAMSSVPRAGAARAMLTPVTQRFMENASAPAPSVTLLGQRRTLFSNCNIVEGVPKVNGFYSLYLKEEAEVRALLYGSTNAHVPALMDFLGVSQVSSDQEFMAWEPRPSALPLITAGQAPQFLNASDTLRLLASSEFDPRKTVCLPEEAMAELVGVRPCGTKVRSTQIAPHRMVAEVESAQPAVVVVAQAFYHPWNATVDGRPARVWRANHAFQAVAIPAGVHRVEFVYRDRAFTLGAAVSLLSVAAAIVGWVRLRQRSILP